MTHRRMRTTVCCFPFPVSIRLIMENSTEKQMYGRLSFAYHTYFYSTYKLVVRYNRRSVSLKWNLHAVKMMLRDFA